MQRIGPLLYDKQETINAYHLREQLSTHLLEPKHIVQFLEGLHNNEREYLGWFSLPEKRKWFKGTLDYFEKQWLKEKGYLSTKARTTAEAVLQLATTQLLKQALDYFNKGKVDTFISYYDYTDGMSEISGVVMGAISEIEGKSQRVGDEAIIEFLKHKKALPNGLTEELDKANHMEWEYFADLLSEDPTGLLAVSEMLIQLEKEWQEPNNLPFHRILPYQYPDLYIAGARFAKTMYEQLFNLWERYGGES